jgi:hypothetical protein
VDELAWWDLGVALSSFYPMDQGWLLVVVATSAVLVFAIHAGRTRANSAKDARLAARETTEARAADRANAGGVAGAFAAGLVCTAVAVALIVFGVFIMCVRVLRRCGGTLARSLECTERVPLAAGETGWQYA